MTICNCPCHDGSQVDHHRPCCFRANKVLRVSDIGLRNVLEAKPKPKPPVPAGDKVSINITIGPMTAAQARKYAATAVDMIDDELMKLGVSVKVVKA